MIQNALAAQTSPRQKVIDAIKRMQADGVPEEQIQRVVARYKRDNNIVDQPKASVDTFRKVNPVLDAMLAPSQQEPHHRLPGVVDSNPLAGLNPAGAFGGYSPPVRKVKTNDAAAMEGANVSNEFQAKTRGVIEDNPVSNFIAGLDPTDVLIPSWKKGLVGHILGGVSGIANIPANVAGNMAVLYDPRASEEQQAKALGGIAWDLAGGAVTGKVLHEAGKLVKPVAAKAGDAIKALVSRGVPKKIAVDAVKAAEKERLNWTPPQDLPGYDAGVAPELKAGLREKPVASIAEAQTGQPLTAKAYHGTGAVFDEFDQGQMGSNTGAPSARKALFYTDDGEAASNYARMAAEKNNAKVREAELEAWRAKNDPIIDQLYAEGKVNEAMALQATAPHSPMSPQWISDPQRHAGANVRIEQVSLKNPLVVDLQGGARTESFADIIDRAKAEGHDGVVFKNVYDDPIGKKPINVVASIVDPPTSKAPAIPPGTKPAERTGRPMWEQPKAEAPKEPWQVDQKLVSTSPDGKLKMEVSYRGPGSPGKSVVFDTKSGMQFEVPNERLAKIAEAVGENSGSGPKEIAQTKPPAAAKPESRRLTVGGTDYNTGGAATEEIMSFPVDIDAPNGMQFYIGKRSADGRWVVSDGKMAPVGFGKTKNEAIEKAKKFFNDSPTLSTPEPTVQSTAKEPSVQSAPLDYQIEHKPMTVEGGAAPLHDLTQAVPEDIYGPNGLQYYGSGDPREKEVLGIFKKVRGKPDATVTIYRGIPADVPQRINPGDWVTLSKSAAEDYASQHPGGKVVSMEVPAKDVTAWGDALLEQGYHPTPKTEPPVASEVAGAPAKEPWQMNAAEFDSWYHDPNRAVSELESEYQRLSQSKDFKDKGKPQAILDAIERIKNGKGGRLDPIELDWQRKGVISDALESGALPPEEAQRLGHFDTYPDLAKKYPVASEVAGAPAVKPSQAEHGKPITTTTVYHGTPDARFEKIQDPRNNGAIWFTDDRKVAASYADDRRAFDYQNATPDILERTVSLKNPKVIDAQGQNWKGTRGAVEQAKAEGHDGLIVKNVVDPYTTLEGKGKAYKKPSTTIAVFDENAIVDPRSNTRQIETPSVSGSKPEPTTPEPVAPSNDRQVTPPPSPSATRHVDTAEVRKLLGMDEYEKNPVSDVQITQKAKAHDPFEVASRVAADGKASGDEVISMGVKLQELREQMQAAKEAGDGETWSKLFAKAEPLADAIDKAGSQTGRDLRARRLLVDNAYDTFGLTRRAKMEAKDAPIHPKVQAQLDSMAAKISDLETQLAQKQIKRQPKPMVDRITEIRARREQALADLLKSTSASSGLSYDQFEAGVRYLKTYVEEGVVRVEDLVGKMKESGVKWSDEDNAKAAKKAIGDYARDLNQGRSAYGENTIVKGTAGIEDKEIAKLRAQIDVEKLRADSLVRSLAPKNKAVAVLTEGAGAIRAAKLSMDLGALLRQGFLGFTSNPKRWGQAIIKGVKAGGSDEAAMMLSNAINEAKLPDGRYAAPLRKNAGLQLTHYATGEFEEPFVAQWIRKIPGLGKAFAGSERLQSGFLNAMRASMFDDFAAKFPEATDQELKQWASYINNALGRSNLKSVHTAANVAFTSPRWAVSRFGVLADTVKAGVSPKSVASRKIVGEAVKAASVVYGGLLLAKERGYDVNLDYTSSDFLKARNGDQVTDFTGAMGPALRVILRIALSKKQGQTPSEEIGNYAVQRLSPAVTSAYQSLRGETLTGYQLDEQQKGWQAWAPLIASQWKQNVEQEGLAKGTAKALGTEMIGISQQNYPKPKPKPDRKTQR